MYYSGFIYLFTQRRTLDWFPAFGHHKYSCYEYSCTDFCVNITFSFLKHKYSGVWLQSCKVSEYLSLCGTAELFTRMTIHPPAIYECSNFSASLPELDIVSIFTFSLYGRCEVVSLCALICIFLKTNNVDHLFFSLFFKLWKYISDLENTAQNTAPLYITTIF